MGRLGVLENQMGELHAKIDWFVSQRAAYSSF